MKSHHRISSVLFILMMSGIEASCMASELETMKYVQPPQPPPVPATPNTQNVQGREFVQTTQANSHQHFSSNGSNMDMQIIGKMPTVNPHDSTQLDFVGGSRIRVTIQPRGEAATVINWNASACISTSSGQSRQCQVGERQQIIAMIKQLPAIPVPPPPPRI